MKQAATIQRIKKTESITGTNYQKAKVLGWNIVVETNKFKENDYCVYCEPQTQLSKAFASQNKIDDTLIGVEKIAGNISEGLCLPSSVLPDSTEIAEGCDVSEILDIQYYKKEIPDCVKGFCIAGFPEIVPKPFEPSVQTLQHVLDKYNGQKCYITEKLDGIPLTIFLYDGYFGVSNPVCEIDQDSDNLFWQLVEKYNLKAKMKTLRGNYAIQAEAVGKDIYGNPLQLNDNRLYVFNGYNIDKKAYLGYGYLQSAMLITGLPMVPVIDHSFVLPGSMEQMTGMGYGNSLLNNNVLREGIVVRPIEEIYENGRISFKVYNPKYFIRE